MVDKVVKKKLGFPWLALILVAGIGVLAFFIFHAPSNQVFANDLETTSVMPFTGKFLQYEDPDGQFKIKYPYTYYVTASAIPEAKVSFAVPTYDESVILSVFTFNKSQELNSTSLKQLVFVDSELQWSEQTVQEKSFEINGVQAFYVKSKFVQGYLGNQTGYFLKTLVKCPDYDALIAAVLPQEFVTEEDTANFMIKSFQCG